MQENGCIRNDAEWGEKDSQTIYYNLLFMSYSLQSLVRNSTQPEHIKKK